MPGDQRRWRQSLEKDDRRTIAGTVGLDPAIRLSENAPMRCRRIGFAPCLIVWAWVLTSGGCSASPSEPAAPTAPVSATPTPSTPVQPTSSPDATNRSGSTAAAAGSGAPGAAAIPTSDPQSALAQCDVLEESACPEPEPNECPCVQSCDRACEQCTKKCRAQCTNCASRCPPDSWECGSACAAQLSACPASCIEPTADCTIACVTESKCQ